MNGIFNIDKPAGWTSHDVVARVRRLAGQKRVGHAGTLDPIATGVLPVVLGTATRLVEYLADADKAYRATVVLGATTDTYDREGTLTPSANTSMPSLQEVETALQQFRGEIEQLPPMHSAIKIGGKKLYELARQGIEVERQPRKVTISNLVLEEYKPPTLQIFVECSKGTYIRSLAHDLGTALGRGAYLEALIRTRHGPFTLEGATTLEGLEAAFKAGTWQESLYPSDHIISTWESLLATDEQEKDVAQGKSVSFGPPKSGDRNMAALRRQSGELLAILYWDGDLGMWRPKKVFNAS